MDKISKNKIRQIASLKQKKVREGEKLFVAEGEKLTNEILLSKLEIKTLVALKEWITSNEKLLKNKIELLEASEEELLRISSLKTPNKVLAVVKIPEIKFNAETLKNKLTLVLDDIQDPGNFGTIIRLADWFGIENIICSESTVELYNPKTIQASMGAILRVNVFYFNLNNFLSEINQLLQLPVYGTFLSGENIFKTSLSPSGLIVMGNESKGISPRVASFINNRITIPSFSQHVEKTESLNVSIATAIICSEFKRRISSL
jgi:TrmH family RNA methyltransferase